MGGEGREMCGEFGREENKVCNVENKLMVVGCAQGKVKEMLEIVYGVCSFFFPVCSCVESKVEVVLRELPLRELSMLLLHAACVPLPAYNKLDHLSSMRAGCFWYPLSSKRGLTYLLLP